MQVCCVSGRHNNGMHPTRDTGDFMFRQRLGRAGDAGRYAATVIGHIIVLSKGFLPLEVNMSGRNRLRCSFCGKNETEVFKLVAGPRVYICDECIAIASQIVSDSRPDAQPPKVEPSAWRKLRTRVRRWLGESEARRVSSLGASS